MSRTTRRLLVLPAAAAAVVLAATPAWAHVHVGADPAGPGATDVVLTFHVPNEEAPAATTGLLVALPSDHPLSGVTPLAADGWTPQLAGSQITWTGGTISGDGTEDFQVRVAQMPADADALTFKVLQTYDDGRTVSWIETAAPGSPEPEHPAPVLDVRTGAAPSGDDVADAPAAGAAAAPAAPAAGTAAPAGDGLGTLIGGLSLAAGLATLGGLVVRRRRGGPVAAPDEAEPGGIECDRAGGARVEPDRSRGGR